MIISPDGKTIGAKYCSICGGQMVTQDVGPLKACAEDELEKGEHADLKSCVITLRLILTQVLIATGKVHIEQIKL